ncbi:TPA: hypothetical protein ACGG8C_002058 [Vibrio cholerae]
MKGIIAWFEQLADDMRFFADKARNFRRNFPHNIKQKMEALKSTKESSTSANQFVNSVELQMRPFEPQPLITPAHNDELFNVIGQFNGNIRTII